MEARRLALGRPQQSRHDVGWTSTRGEEPVKDDVTIEIPGNNKESRR